MEVTALTVHPKSCYSEIQFLSTGFCSSYYALRTEKANLSNITRIIRDIFF